MMKRYVCALVLCLWAVSASAQSKPYGAFDVGVECKNVPSWITFSGLSAETSQQDMAKAAQCSREKNMKWVLKFGFNQLDGTENQAREVKTRAIVSGLLPYILALQFNEEWYGQASTGQWGPPSFDLYDAVAQYGGEQHRILKEVFGLPVVYVDAFVNSNRAYGLGFYKPLPPNTDVLAIETYVPKGGTWATHVKPFVDYTLATTSQPIVLVGQTFKHPREWNDQWQNGPKEQDGREFKLLLQNPRVIAAWLFTWRNRINGIRGGESMPDVVGWFR